MKKVWLLFCCFFLLGCSKPDIELSGYTTPLQVPTEKMSYITLNLPQELFPVIATDNVNYFELQHDVHVYRVTKSEETDDSNTCVIPIDDEWSCMVTWKDSKIGNAIKNAGYTRDELHNLPLVETSIKDKLDACEDMSEKMQMSTSLMYMPEGIIQTLPGLYNTDILLEKDGYIACWIQDGLRDDIMVLMSSYLHCNSGFETHNVDIVSKDNVIYMYDDNRVIVAIQLQRNEWCIYHATAGYLPYIETAVNKLKSTVS